MVPVDTLYVILRLLLPMSSQSELLSILGLINAQYSEAMIENDSSGEEVGHRKKR